MSPATRQFDHLPLLDQSCFLSMQTKLTGKMPVFITYYMEDTAHYIERIEQALEEENTMAIIPPAHTAKSSSRQLGLVRTGEIAAAIESLARQELQRPGAIPSLTLYLHQLKHAFAQTRELLSTLAA